MRRPAIPQGKLVAFCRKWKVRELALFGSYLRDDFTAQSDVDFLVEFEPDAVLSLGDLIQAELELGEVVGRKADLVLKPSLLRSSNYLRKRSILDSAQVIYAP